MVIIDHFLRSLKLNSVTLYECVEKTERTRDIAIPHICDSSYFISGKICYFVRFAKILTGNNNILH